MPDFLHKILLWLAWGAVAQLDPGWQKRVEDEAAQRAEVEAREAEVEAATKATQRELSALGIERATLAEAEASDDNQLTTLKDERKKIDEEPDTTVSISADDALRADLRQPL